MALTPERPKQRLWPIGYILAVLSLIPILGIPFALTAVVRGLLTRRRGGKLVALAGLLGLIASLGYYFWSLDKLIDKRKADTISTAQQALNLSVNTIEIYKVEHGQYPNALAELYKEEANSSDLNTNLKGALLIDPRTGKLFFYQRIDSGHYYLRGVAPDGQPFSEGALIPQTTNNEIGVRRNRDRRHEVRPRVLYQPFDFALVVAS